MFLILKNLIVFVEQDQDMKKNGEKDGLMVTECGGIGTPPSTQSWH